jgi:hypothetical protein
MRFFQKNFEWRTFADSMLFRAQNTCQSMSDCEYYSVQKELYFLNSYLVILEYYSACTRERAEPFPSRPQRTSQAPPSFFFSCVILFFRSSVAVPSQRLRKLHEMTDEMSYHVTYYRYCVVCDNVTLRTVSRLVL